MKKMIYSCCLLCVLLCSPLFGQQYIRQNLLFSLATHTLLLLPTSHELFLYFQASNGEPLKNTKISILNDRGYKNILTGENGVARLQGYAMDEIRFRIGNSKIEHRVSLPNFRMIRNDSSAKISDTLLKIVGKKQKVMQTSTNGDSTVELLGVSDTVYDIKNPESVTAISFIESNRLPRTFFYTPSMSLSAIDYKQNVTFEGAGLLSSNAELLLSANSLDSLDLSYCLNGKSSSQLLFPSGSTIVKYSLGSLIDTGVIECKIEQNYITGTTTTNRISIPALPRESELGKYHYYNITSKNPPVIYSPQDYSGYIFVLDSSGVSRVIKKKFVRGTNKLDVPNGCSFVVVGSNGSSAVEVGGYFFAYDYRLHDNHMLRSKNIVSDKIRVSCQLPTKMVGEQESVSAELSIENISNEPQRLYCYEYDSVIEWTEPREFLVEPFDTMVKTVDIGLHDGFTNDLFVLDEARRVILYHLPASPVEQLPEFVANTTISGNIIDDRQITTSVPIVNGHRTAINGYFATHDKIYAWADSSGSKLDSSYIFEEALLSFLRNLDDGSSFVNRFVTDTNLIRHIIPENKASIDASLLYYFVASRVVALNNPAVRTEIIKQVKNNRDSWLNTPLRKSLFYMGTYPEKDPVGGEYYYCGSRLEDALFDVGSDLQSSTVAKVILLASGFSRDESATSYEVKNSFSSSMTIAGEFVSDNVVQLKFELPENYSDLFGRPDLQFDLSKSGDNPLKYLIQASSMYLSAKEFLPPMQVKFYNSFGDELQNEQMLEKNSNYKVEVIVPKSLQSCRTKLVLSGDSIGFVESVRVAGVSFDSVRPIFSLPSNRIIFEITPRVTISQSGLSFVLSSLMYGSKKSYCW